MLEIVAFACFAILLAMWLVLPERASGSPAPIAAAPAESFSADASPVKA